MKVTKNYRAEFSELHAGDIFMDGGKLFLKIKEIPTASGPDINCVNIETGETGSYQYDCIIMPLPDAEIIMF